jgi:aspartate aminotransferase
MKEIMSNPLVDSLVMPENLKVGLMVAEHRKMCEEMECDFDYYSFAFGQSPFPVPRLLEEALAQNASKGHYSAAEGILELREAIAGFNKSRSSKCWGGATTHIICPPRTTTRLCRTNWMII